MFTGGTIWLLTHGLLWGVSVIFLGLRGFPLKGHLNPRIRATNAPLDSRRSSGSSGSRPAPAPRPESRKGGVAWGPWSFSVTQRPSTGVAVTDVRFRGERRMLRGGALGGPLGLLGGGGGGFVVVFLGRRVFFWGLVGSWFGLGFVFLGAGLWVLGVTFVDRATVLSDPKWWIPRIASMGQNWRRQSVKRGTQVVASLLLACFFFHFSSSFLVLFIFTGGLQKTINCSLPYQE